MPTQIRYVSTPTDFWIADAQGHNSGVWVTRPELAKQFGTEADAKRFLVVHGYDLPSAQVVFEEA